MKSKDLITFTFAVLGIVSFGLSIFLLIIIADCKINELFIIELGLIFCNVLFFSFYKELRDNEK